MAEPDAAPPVREGPPGGRPPWALSWGTVAALGAAAALLLALFVSRAGSPIAVTAALALAAVLAGVAAAAALRTHRSRTARAGPGRGPARRAPERRPGEARFPGRPGPGVPPPGPPESTRAGGAPSGKSGTSGAARPADGTAERASAEGAAPLQAETPPTPAGVGPDLAAVAGRLAQDAARRLGAPAAAVLVPNGRRLTAAGTAGDWRLARQLQAEGDAAAAAAPWRPSGAPSPDPPELPLDDHLPQVLALYPRAVPLERWHELEDVPAALLPLLALADRAAAVAVPLGHRGRLAGLCVVARRPAGPAYADAALAALERLARAAAPALAAALAQP
jgi:hypothetical protein